MKTQWIKSWRERGVQGVSPDKRLVLLMEDYDYAFKFEELSSENKYVEKGKIVISSNGGDAIKLVQGFFHRLLMLKSKTFAGKDKAPDPVLFDVTLPIFRNNAVEALRFTSVNKDDGTGKLKRESILSMYRYPNYDAFKEYNNKIPEKGQLKAIPKDYMVAFIKFNNMPITNGSFVYNDVAVLESISTTLDSAEVARVWHPVIKQLDRVGEESNTERSVSTPAPAAPVEDFTSNNVDEAPKLEGLDEEYPF